MSEFETPSSYKSLNKLFTREFKTPRKIDESEDTFISPADSFVTSQGKIKDDLALQIKGFCYSVEELLTDNFNTKKIKNGEYMNFYLSPKDYHRYHVPFDCQITKVVHVPGALYPVNNTYLNSMPELFVKNERVIVECKVDKKVFYMVLVGALNVGKMTISFEPSIQTNRDSKEIKAYEYKEKFVKKGYELGYFMMGSTVVLLWEKGLIELEDKLQSKLTFGSLIGWRK